MNIDFPSNPTPSQIFDDPISGRAWLWDSEKWVTYNPATLITSEQIEDNAILNTKLRDSSGYSVIGRATSTIGDPADIIASTQEHVLKLSASALEFGQVQEAGIADEAITTNKIANDAVTGDKIADGTITGDKLSSGAIPSSVPTGSITAFGGLAAKVPSGWVLCNGASYSSTDPTYAALFDVIGTNFGSAGASTFRVPDLQSKFPAGLGTANWSNVMGETGGSAAAVVLQHTHDISHDHNISHQHTGSTTSDGAHDHVGGTLSNLRNDGGNHYVRPATFSRTETHPVTDTGGGHAHNISITNQTGTTSGSATPKNSLTPTGSVTDPDGTRNLPPYITLNYIIKL